MSKRSCFRTPLGNQRVKGFQTRLKSARQQFWPTLPWIRGKLNWEKSALVISEIIRLFVNTLSVDEKYSRRNLHNFRQQVQTPRSQKDKTFCGFFIAFLKCSWNVEDFFKKDEYPSLIISENIESKVDGYLNV